MSHPISLSRRHFLRGASAVAAGLAAAACAAPAAPQPAAAPAEAEAAPEATTVPAAPAAVKIVLSSWYNGPFKELLAQFNEKHPNVTMEFVDEAFAAHHEKLLTALVAGAGAPDIAGVEDAQLAKMADTGGLADITDLMAPYKDKLVPYKWRLSTYQNKNYSVPWDGSPCALYYRRDLCEQYEIDPEQIETYDDWLAAGLKLKEATDGKVRLTSYAKDNATFLVSQIWQRGGAVYDVNDESKVLIDSDLAIKTLDFTKQVWDSGTVYQGEDISTIEGAAVALPPWPIWQAGFLRGSQPELIGKWGIVRVPAWEKGGSRAFTWGGSQLAITGQSKAPAEAFKFLEFTQLTQFGQETLWTKGDLFPVLADAQNWDIMAQPVDFYGGQPALKLYAEINAEVLPYAFSPGWSEALLIIGQQMAEVLDGRKTSEQALQDAAAEIREKQGLS